MLWNIDIDYPECNNMLDHKLGDYLHSKHKCIRVHAADVLTVINNVRNVHRLHPFVQYIKDSIHRIDLSMVAKGVTVHDYPLRASSPRLNRYHLADGVFKFIFLRKTYCILLRIWLNCVPNGSLANICLNKDRERHTAHTIVSWPNPKQWIKVHTSDLMMIIRPSVHSHSHHKGNG